MTCGEIQSGSIPERYVLGELDEGASTAYEDHYFSCPACLAELQTLQSLQKELKAAPVASRPATAWRWWAAAAAMLVVGAAVTWRISQPAPSGPVAQNQKPADRPGLELLARFEPPPWNASVQRGGDQAADVRNAMQLYAKADYAA